MLAEHLFNGWIMDCWCTVQRIWMGLMRRFRKKETFIRLKEPKEVLVTFTHKARFTSLCYKKYVSIFDILVLWDRL